MSGRSGLQTEPMKYFVLNETRIEYIYIPEQCSENLSLKTLALFALCNMPVQRSHMIARVSAASNEQ